MSTSPYTVIIYTDGASRGNPGPAGYGVIMESTQFNYRKEFSDGFRISTNNRMELLAVIIGLENLKLQNTKALVVSDSKYVVDSVTKGWVFGWEKKGFTGKKNPDLWMRFLKAFRKHQIDFKWIKGHNAHPQNERCDELAVIAAQQSNLKTDLYFESNS